MLSARCLRPCARAPSRAGLSAAGGRGSPAERLAQSFPAHAGELLASAGSFESTPEGFEVQGALSAACAP